MNNSHIKLDNEQIKAVTSNNKNTLVVAAPGSGKTTVIINRIDYLIKYKKINENNIIIITFTKAAAKNMKFKYKNFTNKKLCPFFGTFHGLCYRILSKYKDINIISNFKAFQVIYNTVIKYTDKISEDKVKEILNYIHVFKNTKINIKDFNISMDKNIFVECFKSYEMYKNEKKLMDFTDLQIKCINLFKHNKLLLKNYRNLFKHVLVDEFQDCDSTQIELLKILCKYSSLFAVGDEDQCIYGFRGSKPECMVNFNKYFGIGEKFFLSTNYRSPSNIIKLSKNLIKNNKIRNKKRIEAFKKKENDINVFCNINEFEQAKVIVSNINNLVKNSKYKFKDIAILYRTNQESRSIIYEFLKNNIPFKLIDKQYSFFDNFICKDIICFLKLSLNLEDKESFISIINKPFRYISKINIEKLLKISIKDNCFELLINLDIPVFQMKIVKKLEKKIKKLKRLNTEDAINSVLYDINYIEYLNNYSIKTNINIEQIKYIIKEFIDYASEFKCVGDFLDYIEKEKKEINKKEVKNGVILSTIHGVKGMEFKNVFIINCNEGNIPHESNLDIEEERRLFYVAITRTIENLWISFCKIIKKKSRQESRFIKECGFVSNCYEFSIFKKGDFIRHKFFGTGKVEKIDEKYIYIRFNNIIRKFNIVTLSNNKLINI
ncbi:putative ATP-dependent DNA helicase YjcD [Clostridium acetireducens DSM 10703]|uniref:DNA 3'-5' helicase n=1 Tax=Clostridium acetireducens DSM 10703 TaxID=1121290 RepID=A0A1E8EYH3_9CLOT|nr:ATP-dependent helicase [Clostridium acetireducens]OFI05600.1 putative ATP-dependent DNA helicase YjcD [Clostridium acetireducens DSM 10703]